MYFTLAKTNINTHVYTYIKYVKSNKKEKEVMSTALVIPRRSPVQVLTEPAVA